MTQNRRLHIVNGMEMYKYFKETHYLENELTIPFNEAMCYGNTCNDLFAQSFIEIRAKVHHVTPAQYTKITLEPLQPLFRKDFDHVTLWFDDDMFCQINVLTKLAWFDRANYRGAVDLHIVGDKFQVIDSFTLKATGYGALYRHVLIEKQHPADSIQDPLRKGIELYLNYLNEDSDLMLYIQQHHDVALNELVPMLIDNFKAYGLGDTQYIELIKYCRRE